MNTAQTSRIIGDGGLIAAPDGFRIEIRLPWYRSLPLSTVEVGEVSIDGHIVDPARVEFELEGAHYQLAALSDQIDKVWYVLDSAYLRVKGPRVTPGTQHDVAVTLVVHPPYIRGLKRMIVGRRALTAATVNVERSMNTGRGPHLGTTLYALTNEFLSRRFSFEDLLREVAVRAIGPGLELVGFQSIRGFPVITDEFADRFKTQIRQYGLVPTSLGINADQEIRRGTVMSEDESVAYHVPQIEAAAKLGFPVARFQYGAGPEVIRRLVPLAEKLNVKLGLEIHAPQHASHPDVLAFREMYAKERSPCLGWIPDFSSTARTVPASLLSHFRTRGVPEETITLAMEFWHGAGDAQTRMGRFKERARAAGANEVHLNELSLIFSMFGKQPPDSWLELMPEVVHVHGKFFGFAENGEEEAIDYGALLPLFRDHGYGGYISSEWEGHMYSTADAFQMIERHQSMCRKILRGG